jgi:hypothetical protein
MWILMLKKNVVVIPGMASSFEVGWRHREHEAFNEIPKLPQHGKLNTLTLLYSSATFLKARERESRSQFQCK